MVHDSLVNAALYRSLGPRIAAALEYVATFDPSTEDGRHAIHGDDLFALVQSYETRPGAEKRFESHRRHLDVQFVAVGRERILHAHTPELEVDTPYAEETDLVFYRDPGVSSSILLRAGDFAIFFPDDAHKPGCMAGGREAVKKVVVKARL